MPQRGRIAGLPSLLQSSLVASGSSTPKGLQHASPATPPSHSPGLHSWSSPVRTGSPAQLRVVATPPQPAVAAAAPAPPSPEAASSRPASLSKASLLSPESVPNSSPATPAPPPPSPRDPADAGIGGGERQDGCSGSGSGSSDGSCGCSAWAEAALERLRVRTGIEANHLRLGVQVRPTWGRHSWLGSSVGMHCSEPAVRPSAER